MPSLTPTQHVQFGVDMSGPFPFPTLLLNTTAATPFYTVRAGFTGACGGWMSWIWPGIAGKCTNLDAFGGTLTNAAVRTPERWELTPSCEAVPGHLPGCNSSCEWTLRADVLEDSHGRSTFRSVDLDASAPGVAYPYLPDVPFAWSGTGGAADVFVTRTDGLTTPCYVTWATNEHVGCPTVAYGDSRDWGREISRDWGGAGDREIRSGEWGKEM